MASEAISSAILIIGAVIGAAFMVTAILPAIFSAGDTFGTVSHAEEEKLKTDFRIVNTYTAGGTSKTVQVWMKNVGSNRISIYDLQKADVYLGIDTMYQKYEYDAGGTTGTFLYILNPADGYWDIGDTVEIKVTDTDKEIQDYSVLFTFSLPNSIRRSTTFSKTVA